jgi:ATP-dependent DNA ligase
MAFSTARSRSADPCAVAPEIGLAAPLAALAALRPMEPRHELQAFREGEWLFEKRYSGMRMLALFGAGEVALRTRTGADCTAWFPEVCETLANVPGGPYLVDGEVTVPALPDSAAHGVVAGRMRQRGRRPGNGPVVYCVFDLLLAYGFDLSGLPLEQRKRQLAGLPLSDTGLLLVQPLHIGNLPLRKVMLEKRIESVVAKRLDSRYEPGRRCPSWVVVKRPQPAPGHGTAA